MIYFTADTHFGHNNIIRFCNRPFIDSVEMDEALIAAWNERVQGNDTVYIVGDMFFRCDNPEEILKKLHGKKRLIIGNHDSSWIKKIDCDKYFLSIDNMLETTDGVHKITLCHYPLLSWNHAQRSYMIHGHIHNDTSMDFWPLLVKRENVLNAGVDVNNYVLVTFDELMENNNKFKCLSLFL